MPCSGLRCCDTCVWVGHRGSLLGSINAGYFNMPGYKPTNITFLMDSDDGSLLSIDGSVVISNPGAVLRMQPIHPLWCHALLQSMYAATLRGLIPSDVLLLVLMLRVRPTYCLQLPAATLPSPEWLCMQKPDNT